MTSFWHKAIADHRAKLSAEAARASTGEDMETVVTGLHGIPPLMQRLEQLHQDMQDRFEHYKAPPTQVSWSGRNLIVLYVMFVFPKLPRLTYSIWFLCAANAFQHSILWDGPVTPSVTLFDGDNRRNAFYVLADVATVMACLAMAVILEFTSRALGVLIAIGFATLGLALFSGAHNMRLLNAGQVFYGIGFTGVRLVVDVLVSDTTQMKNRSFGYAFLSIPWAITAYSVPPIRKTPDGPGLRRALAAFTGIIPSLGAVLFGFLLIHRQMTKQAASFKSVLERLWGGPTPGRFNANNLQPKTFRGWWTLGLPLTTFCLVGSMLALFILLWLVQMGILPWFAVIPPIATFFLIVIFVISLNYERFNPTAGYVLGWMPLVHASHSAWTKQLATG